MPVRRVTMGAYRNMIVTVFRLVLMTFCSWFPSAATIQLLKIVRKMGFGFFISFRSSDSWRLRTAGYIIKKRHNPMGMLMPRICHAFSATLSGRPPCRRLPKMLGTFRRLRDSFPQSR